MTVYLLHLEPIADFMLKSPGSYGTTFQVVRLAAVGC